MFYSRKCYIIYMLYSTRHYVILPRCDTACYKAPLAMPDQCYEFVTVYEFMYEILYDNSN